MAKNNKKPQEIIDLELKNKLIREGSKSLEDYNNLLAKTRELQNNLNHIEIQHRKVKVKYDAQELKYKAALATNNKKLIADEEAELDKLKEQVDYLEERLRLGERNLEIHQEAVSQVSKLALGFKSVGKQVAGLGKLLLKQTGYLLEQQKAVKETELQMGVLSNQANGFRNNIYKASINTNKIGIGTKDLAKIQGTYSDNIGRSVQLSEEQLIAMSELAKGTVLGVEGAAEFAAEMEKFGISAKGSAEFVEDILQTSGKMGLSSSKVIKNIQQNIKLANKYSFKGGVKGLGEMAQLATKFKFEMQDIANFAENLITPEGAVEAAAKLQVLGGAWARLGDPFELMYRSRNDMKGLTEDIINATKETARFDKATGEVTIDPMELHRLREVANATGMSFDSLANSAREAAKFSQIESQMSGIFSEEDKTYLSSLAQFDKKSGKFKVTLQTKDGAVTESVDALQKITPELLKSQQEYQQTLKQNAEQAMTFAETWDNIKNTFRSVLLPGFEAFSGALNEGLGGFHDWAKNEGVFDKMVDFGKWVGELAATVVKFITNNPITSALTLGAGYLAGKAAMWIANGRLLRYGFNMGGPMGGGGVTGPTGGVTGPTGGLGGGKFGKFGSTKGGMSLGKSATKGLKVGGGLGIAALGLDIGRNFMDDPDSGGGKALGVLGNAAEWASYGAMLGSIIPGLGTVAGGLIGGAAGGIKGMFDEGIFDGDKGVSYGMEQNDFISRPNQDVVPFTSQDTLIGAKPNGPIDKLLNNAEPGNNSTIVDASSLINSIEKRKNIERFTSKENTNKPSNNKVSVEFNKPLAVEGRLELFSGNNSVNIDLNDPLLIRELSRKIKEELTSAINGGRISSNPVSA